MLSIGSEKKHSPQFELVVQIRDNKGFATGKTKSFVTEQPNELETIWNRYSGKIKKRRKKKVDAAKSNEDIKTALKETESHIQKIRKKKKLED